MDSAKRGSRLRKILALTIAVITILFSAANIFLLIYTVDQNLYYADYDAVSRKVYAYVAEITANDIVNYYGVKKNLERQNSDYLGYYYSETELYRSKYAVNNSNVSFTVTDSDGNIELENFPLSENDCRFSFQTNFTNYFSKSGSYNFAVRGNEPKTENRFSDLDDENNVTEESTEYEQPVTSSPEETLTASTEITSAAANENITKPQNASDITAYDQTTSASVITNRTLKMVSSSGETYIFEYVFGDDYDEEIFNYCKDIAEEHIVDGIALFYQQDYMYDPYGNVISVEDYNNNLTNLTITIKVPYSLKKGDIYYTVSKIISIAYSYCKHIIPVTVISAILFLLSVIYIFYAAGYVKNSSKPKAGGLHKFPFDVLVLAFVTFMISAANNLYYYSSNGHSYKVTYDYGFIFFFIAIGLIMTLVILETLTVRLRAHVFVKYTLIGFLWRNTAKFIKFLSGNISIMWKSVIITGIFAVCELLFSALAHESYSFAPVVALILLVSVIFGLLAVATAYILNILQKGAQKISNGENYRISHWLLKGEFKKHADYLNNINNTITKSVQEKLKSESMKTELITNVSHDLKTPLTSIINYIDLLKKTDITDDNAKEYIEIINRQSQRLKKLTIDIVDASKAATGNIKVNYEKTALGVILSQMNGEYIESLEKSELSLVCDAPNEEIYINADGRLLWRVLDNLMNNVCKYSQPGTRVYVGLYENNNKACLTIKNISHSELNISADELTERFVRGDSSRNTEGSGLGLSIAKSLTELMGGKFELSIDGDLFKITLLFNILEQ